jgi:hypothetical protein
MKSNTCTHAQRLSQDIDHGFESNSTFHRNRKQTFMEIMIEPRNHSHRFKSNLNLIFNRKSNTCTHTQRLNQEIDHRFESNSTFHRNRKANFYGNNNCNTDVKIEHRFETTFQLHVRRMN